MNDVNVVFGLVPNHWRRMRLRHFFTLYSGGTPLASNDNNYTDEGVSFVNISDMTNVDYIEYTNKKITEMGIEEKNLKILNPGTILYSIYASLGSVSELTINATISQAILALLPKKDTYIDKNYFKLLLMIIKDNIPYFSNGTTQNNLNADIVKNLPILVPELSDQVKIRIYVDRKILTINSLISNQLQQIEKLKEYKQSLISEVVTKGLDSNVLYMDSGIEWIGQIPKHWKITRNKYVMNKKKLIINAATELPVLSLSVNGVIIRDIDNPKGKMPTSFDGYQEVFPNNLLLCLFDIDVTPCCVGHIENHGITSPAYSQFELSSDSSSRYYYYLLLNIDYQKSYLHLSKNLRSSLTEDLFGAIPTIQPPYREQLQIAKYIEEKFKKIDDLILKKIKKLDNIQDYKKTLVYEYVTGKKEVS